MNKARVNPARIGRYGKMRLDFIKEYRQELYTQLLFSDGMEDYLAEINERAKSVWHRESLDISRYL